MKNIKWIMVFILVFSSFSALTQECELRLNGCDVCQKDRNLLDWDDWFFIDRAATQIPGDDGCTPCWKFCIPWRDSDGFSREAQEKLTKKTASANDRRLIVGQNNNVTLQIANINPDAAYALHILGFFSKKVDHILPAKSEIRNKRSRTTAEVIEIIMGRNQQKSGQTDPNLTHLAQINQMPYELIEHADGQAFLVLGQRTVDQQGRVIRQAWPDVRVRLQWAPAGEAGYWQPVALENP